jgi:integrase/recombinase XerC
MSSDSPLLPAVEGFLRYLKVERQLSPLTQQNYARQLQAIITMADEMKITAWTQLEPAQVRNIAARSRRAGLGTSSLALRLSALRSFLDWQVSQDMLSGNPAKGIATPRNARHLPSTRSTSCWKLTSTIRWRCAIAPCWRPCMVAGCVCRSW